MAGHLPRSHNVWVKYWLLWPWACHSSFLSLDFFTYEMWVRWFNMSDAELSFQQQVWTIRDQAGSGNSPHSEKKVRTVTTLCHEGSLCVKGSPGIENTPSHISPMRCYHKPKARLEGRSLPSNGPPPDNSLHRHCPGLPGTGGQGPRAVPHPSPSSLWVPEFLKLFSSPAYPKGITKWDAWWLQVPTAYQPGEGTDAPPSPALPNTTTAWRAEVTDGRGDGVDVKPSAGPALGVGRLPRQPPLDVLMEKPSSLKGSRHSHPLPRLGRGSESQAELEDSVENSKSHPAGIEAESSSPQRGGALCGLWQNSLLFWDSVSLFVK